MDIEDYIIDMVGDEEVYVSVNYEFISIKDSERNINIMIYHTKNYILMDGDYENPYMGEYNYVKILSHLTTNNQINYWNPKYLFDIFKEQIISYNREQIINNILEENE